MADPTVLEVYRREITPELYTEIRELYKAHSIAEDVREKTILITDHNKFTVSTGTKAGTSDDGTFTIDPTKNPKTVDSTQGSGADKGKVVLGIYEIIDDNHKRACWATTGNGRPTDFISKPGSGWLLQNWERIK